MIQELPATDLKRLSEEVQSASAALPCNLSDYWLDLIARDLDTLQEGSEDDGDDEPGPSLSGPLYLILRILMERTGGESLNVSEEEMYSYFQSYQIEIGLEMVSRRTEVKADPATLETIFRNRDVLVSRGVARGVI